MDTTSAFWDELTTFAANLPPQPGYNHPIEEDDCPNIPPEC